MTTSLLHLVLLAVAESQEEVEAATTMPNHHQLPLLAPVLPPLHQFQEAHKEPSSRCRPLKLILVLLVQLGRAFLTLVPPRDPCVQALHEDRGLLHLLQLVRIDPQLH